MAIEELIMPQLGESVTEGRIEKWLVKAGDYVRKYDPIADVMTDKVNAEIPSSFSGTIKEIITPEGTTIAVGEVICTIETEEATQVTEEVKQAQAEKQAEMSQEGDQESMKTRYSPAVLKLAQEHMIDLTSIKGTGRAGRITRKDVETYIESGGARESLVQDQVTNTGKKDRPSVTASVSSKGDLEIPVTGVRKKIAENMVMSKQEIPHAWMTIEVDVTDLVSYRESIKKDFLQREGYNLTYFAFFIKAVAQGLKKYPALNSTWAGDKIIQRKDVNLSIAVAKEDELYVPVIKRADEKSIKGIAQDIYDLAKRTREGKLRAEDMQGGSFTVNNTGSFGSIHSMGIINHPQAAILQVESIVKRPVIIDNMFAARDIVNLCLSLDHRVLDGLVCGKFLAYVKDTLENMNENTLNIY